MTKLEIEVMINEYLNKSPYNMRNNYGNEKK